MIFNEIVFHENLITFLGNNVYEFFVQSYGRQQRYLLPFAARNVLAVVFCVNSKLGHELPLTNRTFYGVAAQIFLEPSQDLLFSESLLALGAFLVEVEKQRVFQNTA